MPVTAASHRNLACFPWRIGAFHLFTAAILSAGPAVRLRAQTNDCVIQTTFAEEIVCESRYLPLELIGFFEYLPPADPDEVPRKYLVERWSGVRQAHHIHSGGSFTQRLTFRGEWRFDGETGQQTTDKSIDYFIHRYATNTDEEGTCANLKNGIVSLPGGTCSNLACGPLTVQPTSRNYEPSGSLRCANGFGEVWTSEDNVAEELLEPDTEEKAMIRAEAKATTGTSSLSFAHDFERNWESYDRLKKVPFPAQKVRFFVNFPPTCPGTYQIVYAYHRWPIGSQRPDEPNHFETDSVTFTEWSTRAPGPSSWIDVPLEKGMNIEIVSAALTNSCDATAAGTVETRLSSVDLSISLGGDGTGGSYGLLILRSDAISDALGQPGSLQFWNTRPDRIEVARSDDGILESIRTPRHFITITPVDATSYRMDHHRRTGNGEPDPESPAETSQTVTFLETGEERILGIAEQAFGRTIHREYRESKAGNGMTLITGSGLRHETLEKSTDEGGITTEERTTRDAAGNVSSHRLERYTGSATGRRLIESVVDPQSAALTTVFEYAGAAATAGPVPGQIRRRIDPDGRWLRYDYDADGRVMRLTESFLNAAIDAPSDEVLERLFHYGTVPDLDGDGIAEILETIDSRAIGQPIGRTFTIELSAVVDSDGRANTETWELVATEPEATWNSSSNLKTITRTITEDPFKGRIARVQLPDGSSMIARFEISGGLVTTTTESGIDPDENGRLQKGSISVRTADLDDNLLSEEVRDIETGVLTHRKLATMIDGRGRPTRFDYLDGSFETQSHDCCGLSAGVDRNGVSFQIEYDALGRVSRSTRAGIRFGYRYDADDRLVEETRIDPEGETETLTRFTYDPAGRLIARTDASGRAQTFAYSALPDGNRLETATHPEGGTTLITRSRDGRPLQVSGTREFPRTLLHGVAETGFFSRETRVGPENAATEWVEVHSDFAGRSHLTRFADGSVETRTYGPRGKIRSLVDRDGISHLYENDRIGSVSLVAIDTNSNGQIDLDGSDRVTRLKRTYVQEDEEWIERTTEEEWLEGSAQPVMVRVNDRWLTRRLERETRGSRTATSRARLLENGDLEITSTRTGEPDVRTLHREGRVVRIETIGMDGGILHLTAFSYDALGRLVRKTDSGQGDLAFEYDALDRVVAATEWPVAADDSDAGRRTIFRHDLEDRLTKVVYPDSLVETRDYTSSGRLSRLDLPRRPMTSFGHDAQGRLIRLSTPDPEDGEPVNTTWTVDPVSGAFTGRTMADGATALRTESPAGRTRTRIGPDEVKTTTTYDEAGDLAGIDYSDATPDVGFERDRPGRVKTLHDGHGTVTLDYDAFGQVVREVRSEGDDDPIILERIYDEADRHTGLTLRIGEESITTTFTYDFLGRLSGVGHGAFNLAIVRNQWAQIVEQKTLRDGPDGPSIRTTSNGYGESLSRSVTTGGDEGPSVTLFTAERDPAGRIVSQRLFGEATWTYSYDAKGWLKTAERDRPEPSGAANRTEQFDRDSSGNPVRRTTSGMVLESEWNPLNQLMRRGVPQEILIEGSVHPETLLTLQGRTVDRSGWLFSETISVDTNQGPVWQPVDLLAIRPGTTSENPDAVTARRSHRFLPRNPEAFDYDADGRLIRDGRWDYVWDAADRLVRMQTREDIFVAIADPDFPQTRLEFAYDSLHRRIRKTHSSRSDPEGAWTRVRETGFLYDGWTLVAELDLLDGSKPIRSYAWGEDLSGIPAGAHGVGGLAAIHDHQTGKTVLPCADATGNIIALIDAETGESVARYDYTPYGEQLRVSGPAAAGNPIRFASRYHDAETGLVYFGRRYYDPTNGRWLSRDPLGEAAGPNLTAYADNDPVNRIDPIGEAVYVVTRPLNGTAMKHLAPAAVHVYLAFDNVGLHDTSRWEQEVVRQNQGSGLVDPDSGFPYFAESDKPQTFSFHPDSVRNEGTNLNQFIVISTEGSYVAYNDDVDIGALMQFKKKPHISVYPIPIHGIEEQLRVFRAAIGSRNFNNYHPEAYHPERYALTRFNCGSWVRYLLKSLGYNYPLDIRRGGLTNLGIGTDYWLGPPMRHLTEAYDAGFHDFEMLFSIPQNLQLGQGRPAPGPTPERIPYLDDYFLAIP